MRSQITCIKTRPPHNSHELIMRVGGVRQDGESFNISRHQCAEDIINGVESYSIVGQGTVLNVTAYQRDADKYIKTKAGNDQVDSLLKLDQC